MFFGNKEKDEKIRGLETELRALKTQLLKKDEDFAYQMKEQERHFSDTLNKKDKEIELFKQLHLSRMKRGKLYLMTKIKHFLQMQLQNQI